MKTPEQEANELVEMLGTKIWFPCEQEATDVSILHVERLIEVLGEVKDSSLLPPTAIFNTIRHYQQVLSILKDKK